MKADIKIKPFYSVSPAIIEEIDALIVQRRKCCMTFNDAVKLVLILPWNQNLNIRTRTVSEI